MTANDPAGSLPPDIVRLLEENMYAYMAHLPARCGKLDGGVHTFGPNEMKLICESGVWLIDGGVSSATFNFICHSRLSRQPDATIAAATQYFAERNRPVGWWTGPSCTPHHLGEQLSEFGYTYGGLYPGMAVRLTKETDHHSPLSGGVKRSNASLYPVRQVQTMDELMHFARIAGAVFDGDVQPALFYYRNAAEVLLRPDSPFRLYLAYFRDEPVATCIGFLHDKTAGIYSVATLPKARRLGIGRALTSHVLAAGQQAGAEYGVLQASSQGYRVYESIGFERCCDFHLWLPPGVTH